MRLGFLALDRPDIQLGAKEAARGMARPTVRHQRMLKRCARYFLQAKTLTWCFARQRFPRCILVRSDTDWAGCPLTRRSTSGTSVHFGQHTWYCSSTTQVPVSLSSGEAETYGVTKAFSRATGVRNLANDLGFERYGELSLEVPNGQFSCIGDLPKAWLWPNPSLGGWMPLDPSSAGFQAC